MIVKNRVSPPMSRTAQTTETAMTMRVVEKVLLGSVGGATVTFGLGLWAVLKSTTGDLFQSIPAIAPFSSLQKSFIFVDYHQTNQYGALMNQTNSYFPGHCLERVQ